MQERGVEPLHLAVQDPKSCASANSATPARRSSRAPRLENDSRAMSKEVELGERCGRCRFDIAAGGGFHPDRGSSHTPAKEQVHMARAVTLFTGQWADLSLDDL